MRNLGLTSYLLNQSLHFSRISTDLSEYYSLRKFFPELINPYKYPIMWLLLLASTILQVKNTRLRESG